MLLVRGMDEELSPTTVQRPVSAEQLPLTHFFRHKNVLQTIYDALNAGCENDAVSIHFGTSREKWRRKLNLNSPRDKDDDYYYCCLLPFLSAAAAARLLPASNVLPRLISSQTDVQADRVV